MKKYLNTKYNNRMFCISLIDMLFRLYKNTYKQIILKILFIYNILTHPI